MFAISPYIELSTARLPCGIARGIKDPVEEMPNEEQNLKQSTDTRSEEEKLTMKRGETLEKHSQVLVKKVSFDVENLKNSPGTLSKSEEEQLEMKLAYAETLSKNARENFEKEEEKRMHAAFSGLLLRPSHLRGSTMEFMNDHRSKCHDDRGERGERRDRGDRRSLDDSDIPNNSNKGYTILSLGNGPRSAFISIYPRGY